VPSGCAALLFVGGLSRLLGQLDHDTTEEGWVQERTEAIGTEAIGTVLPATITAAVRAAGGFETVEDTAVVDDWDDVIDDAPDVVIPPRRVWVRHRIRPRERLTQIAARYGTTAEEIIADNHLDGSDPSLRKWKRIRVRASRLPPPRVKVKYVASAADTWDDIAAKLHVERLDLHAWNWQKRSLWEGRELVAWVDPGAAPTLRPGQGPEIPEELHVPPGGESTGRPHRGRLKGGVLLPESDLYTRRTPTHGLWGSSHTILQIQRAFAAFRHDSGYDGEVTIGALSRKHGGRFHPHVSHQSGRDIDIRLPLLPGVPETDVPNADEVDWYATWALIDAFVDTGEVSVIFLEVDLHRRLYEAARALGERREDLAEVLRFPTWAGGEGSGVRPIVRHSKGHDGHIHVRIECGPLERRCRRK
jgi:hypothetical protein